MDSEKIKCDICGRYFNTKIKFVKDRWHNVYCLLHLNELPKCSSCGRLICRQLTQGGTYFADGFLLCHLCEKVGVFYPDRGKKLLSEMRKELKKNGLDLENLETPIRVVNREELIKHSSKKSNKGHLLLGLTRSMISKIGNKVVDSRFLEILIQEGLPEEHFKLVAIHELCHAWIFYRGIHCLPLQVEEGVCVLSEYLWLQRQSFPQSLLWKKKIIYNIDPIYGDGFRKAFKCIQKMPLPRMMRYIKKKKKFPNFLANLFWV